MPELPEVETVRRQLAKKIEGAKLVSIALWQSDREAPKGDAFVHALVGKTVSTVDRRAKLLLWRFTDGSGLAVHLKMTGKLLFYSEKPAQPERHERLLFEFEKAGKPIYLVWKDLRRFGYLKVMPDPAVIAEILEEYGPEPLVATPQELAERLAKPSSRSIKAVLLDQSVIAGIGNIYADEACFLAGIHPSRIARDVTPKERLLLAEAIKDVLQRSVTQRGTSAHDYLDTKGEKGGFLKLLQVYGKKGRPCPKCQTLILKTVLAGRGTHACPKCQPVKVGRKKAVKAKTKA